MANEDKHEVTVPLFTSDTPNRNGVVFPKEVLAKACETFNSRNLNPEQKKAILTQEPLQLGIRANVTMEADGVTIKKLGPLITFNLIG